MAPEQHLDGYFTHLSHQSLCLYVYPFIVARQRPGKNVTAATNTRNKRIIVGRVVFYKARVVSRSKKKKK
jgi:hypothetical protein